MYEGHKIKGWSNSNVKAVEELGKLLIILEEVKCQDGYFFFTAEVCEWTLLPPKNVVYVHNLPPMIIIHYQIFIIHGLVFNT